MNVELAEIIINKLTQLGVKTFCICPGGRLAPFLEVLSCSKGLEILYFYEERSCSFFALGRVRRDRRPVAVITTSGTAVAELLPGVIESYYSGLPLVLVTADRPSSYREQASPQTIKNPIDLFKDYSHCSLDVSELKDLKLNSWYPQRGHLHLNVAFDEPLLDSTPHSIDFSKHSFKKSVSIYSDLFIKANEKDFQKFFKKCKKPLILVGELQYEEKPIVEKFLANYDKSFYVEPLSQLHYLKERLYSGEKILYYGLQQKEIDGVIRLGGIPRCRFWRDLEKLDVEVLNLSSPPFYSGLSKKTLNFSLLDNLDLLKKHLSLLQYKNESLKDYDREQSQKWKKILETYPKSEDAWMGKLKTYFPENSQVFLGNSLPIRLWDRVSFLSNQRLLVTGQSGVNGIDGLTSRFFGECKTALNNFAVIGDLSVLYDLSAFWISKNIPPWTLFIVNNSGGQIFSHLFKNEMFINKHNLSFSPLARLWGLNYESFKDFEKFDAFECKPYSLVEICPDKESTDKVFKNYVSFWDT